MLRDGVRYLVRHHSGQPFLGLRHLQDSGVDRHLAARQAEGVSLRRVDQRELPLESRVVVTDRLGNTLAYPLNHLRVGSG